MSFYLSDGFILRLPKPRIKKFSGHLNMLAENDESDRFAYMFAFVCHCCSINVENEVYCLVSCSRTKSEIFGSNRI